jgi:hypothetical protein
MKKHIRTAIRSAVKTIREARADRSIPALMGYGWTVAIRDSNSCLSLEAGNGYSFAGSWNRKSVFYTKTAATRILFDLRQSRPELSLVVAHHNDLRDRQEQSALECLAACLLHRNSAA